MLVKQLIKRHEGLMLKPYKCSAGKTTIGYGRNLEDNGITEEEANFLLEVDIRNAVNDCHKLFRFFDQLCEVRQAVLIDMMFNMGLSRLRTFKKMIAALEKFNYKEASIEMLDSKWAVQVGNKPHQRAGTLAYMMATGEVLHEFF